MSSNEPLPQREKEPNAVEASTGSGCQCCTPRRARAVKPATEQHVEAAGEQAAAPSAAREE